MSAKAGLSSMTLPHMGKEIPARTISLPWGSVRIEREGGWYFATTKLGRYHPETVAASKSVRGAVSNLRGYLAWQLERPK